MEVRRSIDGQFEHKGKGKVLVLLLTEHHAKKAYWESGGIAPCILDLGIR